MTPESNLVFANPKEARWLKTEDNIIDMGHITRFSVQRDLNESSLFSVYAHHIGDLIIVKFGFTSREEAVKYLHIIIGDKLNAI